MPQHVIDPDLQQQPQCRRRGRGESPGRRRTCGRVAARHRRHGRLSDFADKVRRVLGDWDAERFNFLVNMAGTSHIGLLGEVTGRLRRRQPRPPQGPFFLTQTLLPLIADGGRIVNISSGLTRIIYPGRIAFGSMKGSVEVMTRNMTKELGPRRITVNTVAPGAIQTDFSGGVVRDNPEVYRHIAEQTALGRPGLPDDIGLMIASLLSEDNRWVNAQRIDVSGGQAI